MTTPTPAASVLLARAPGSRELLAVRRGRQLRFFGGFWAFPGGKVEPQDGSGPDALRHAACRELFEETGLLLVRHADGSPVTDDVAAARRDVLAGTLRFDQFLAERQLVVRAEDFHLVGTITTPPFSSLRFATTFFGAVAPAMQTFAVWPGELDEGAWVEPAALLCDWERGHALLTPPTVLILEALRERPIEEAPARVGPMFERLPHPIFFAPRVQALPLRTVALPPATHTNAVLIGNGPRYLIDPGPDAPEEQAALCRELDGKPPTAIILSHHHPDHVGAAAVCAQRYRVPILAHPLTAERLSVTIGRHLNDGDRLDLGPSPADGRSWALEVLHTPGHAPGHLAFFEPVYGLLLAGDLLSTVTSMVIAPPDGDLAVYLQSLHRVRRLPARLLLPAHGNVSADPSQVIDGALDHRARREAQLLEALARGPARVDELAAALYRGLPEANLRFAQAQVRAGLLKLQHEGRARPDGAGETWVLS